MFDTNSLDRWKDNEVDCHFLTRSWCNPFASSWLEKYCNTRLKLCVVCFIKHNKLKSSNRSTNTSIYGWLQRGVQLALVCLHVLATKLRSSLDEINLGLGKLYVWFFIHSVRRSYSLIIQIDRKTATDLLFWGTSVALCFRIHTSYDNWKFDSMQILQVLSFDELLRHNIFNQLNVWWFKTTKSQNSHWEISFLLKNLPGEENWGKSICMLKIFESYHRHCKLLETDLYSICELKRCWKYSIELINYWEEMYKLNK